MSQEQKEDPKELVKKRMEHIDHKIMVMSGKGGVGKSTVAVNLAISLQMNGYSVGLLDADLHGPNVPQMLGLDAKKPDATSHGILPVQVPVGLNRRLEVMSIAFLIESEDPVIWRGPMKIGALQEFLGQVEWGDLDYLIIDLPPGTGDEPLSIAQLIPEQDGAIVVTTPQEVSISNVKRSVSFSRKLEIPVLGIIENMSGFVCPHCGETTYLFKKGGGQKAAKDLGIEFLGSIPLDQKIVEQSDAGKAFVLSESESDASEAFQKIVEKLTKG